MIASIDERDDAIASLLPLVRRIARRIHRLIPLVDIDDLIGDGSLGAIRAVDAFDPLRGPTLQQYAAHIIAGVMLNGVRRWDPLSERARRELRRADRERYDTAMLSGTLISEAALEARRPHLAKARSAAWVAQPLSMDSGLPPGMDLPVDWSSDPATICEREYVRGTVRGLLQTLRPRQRELLITHYYGDQSLRSIARKRNVSPQRLSQVHRRAIESLRRKFDAQTY